MAGRSYRTVQYPYIKIDLDSGFSLTQDANSRPNYFLSLSHERFVDRANTATIKIQFVPNNYTGAKNEVDPNIIDTEIVKSFGLCNFRYGIEKEYSSQFRALIYDYSVSLSNGMVSYDLKLISTAVIYNFSNVSSTDYTVKKDMDANEVLSIMSKIVEENMGGTYKFDIANSTKSFVVPKEIEGVKSANAMTLLQNIAQNLTKKGDENKNASEIDTFYKIVVDDKTVSTLGKSGNAVTGIITLVEYTSSGVSNIVYTFEWGTKNTDIISWSTEYIGEAIIMANRAKSSNKDKTLSTTGVETSIKDSITLDGTGISAGVRSQSSSFEDTSNTSDLFDFSEGVQSAIENINDFIEKANYPYNANLTVLGLAGKKGQNLHIGVSKVEVNPILNGRKHHTAGVYVVQGIVDNVDSSGFTTTLKLQKYANQNYKLSSGWGTDDSEEDSSSNKSFQEQADDYVKNTYGTPMYTDEYKQTLYQDYLDSKSPLKETFPWAVSQEEKQSPVPSFKPNK